MAKRTGLALAALLVGLLAAVAVASRARTPSGGGGTHRIDGPLVVEYLSVAAFALSAVLLPVVVWALWRGRARKEELPPRTRRWRRLITVVTMIMLVLAGYLVYRAQHRHPETVVSPRPHGSTGAGGGRSVPSAARQPVDPGFDWVPAIVVFSTVLGGALAAVVLLRRRGPGVDEPTEADLARQLSLVLDDSLDDLRAEADPRRAVIGAYARMERALAAAGLPRHLAEAPLEYMTRVLRDLLRASAVSVKRLTDLFEWAKFSRHEVDHGMKDEAIAALVAVRDELRAAAR
jgi:Domain of unknown function (DUF4129)